MKINVISDDHASTRSLPLSKRHNQIFLSPVDAFEQFCQEEGIVFRLSQRHLCQKYRKRIQGDLACYRLLQKPESLKSLVDLFRHESHLQEEEEDQEDDASPSNPIKYDYNRLIWTSNKAFVCISRYRQHQHSKQLGSCFPAQYRTPRFKLWLKDNQISSGQSFSIHASTLEDAIECLDFVASLPDDYFSQLQFSCSNTGYTTTTVMYDYLTLMPKRHNDARFRRGICPLPCPLLEKLLFQSTSCSSASRSRSRRLQQQRVLIFDTILFTPEQSCVLARCGVRTNLVLEHCTFLDKGAAFVAAVKARKNYPHVLGLATLTITWSLPMDEEFLTRLLREMSSTHNNNITIESLALYFVRFRTSDTCQALATAALQNLDLRRHRCMDGGAALVEAVRQDRVGPRGLCLAEYSLDRRERFFSFLEGLQSNTRLQRLDLVGIRDHAIARELTVAIGSNTGLNHFGLHFSSMQAESWKGLIQAIAQHPNLCTLSFRHVDTYGCLLHERTQSVADMLSVNDKIETIYYDELMFDPLLWEMKVVPRLEWNLYKRRFTSIAQINLVSTRAAVLARALAVVSKSKTRNNNSRPTLAWLLLLDNCDVIGHSNHV